MKEREITLDEEDTEECDSLSIKVILEGVLEDSDPKLVFWRQTSKSASIDS